MMRAPPEEVEVIGHLFAVLLDPPGLSEGNFGEMDLEHHEISLDSKQNQQLMRDTMLHEIIHVIEKHLYLKLSERQVQTLAVCLVGVMRKNPKLVDWFMEGADR